MSCEQSDLSGLFHLNNFYRVEDFTRIKDNRKKYILYMAEILHLMTPYLVISWGVLTPRLENSSLQRPITLNEHMDM